MKIKLLSDKAMAPTYGSEGAGAIDLYATEDMTIIPRETRKVPLGIAAEVPEGYVLLIVPRSSIGYKTDLRMSNSVGVIDSDYRGEICAIYTNEGTKAHFIKAGDRVAQAMLIKSEHIKIEVVEELSETKRGDGGFGSTGV